MFSGCNLMNLEDVESSGEMIIRKILDFITISIPDLIGTGVLQMHSTFKLFT